MSDRFITQMLARNIPIEDELVRCTCAQTHRHASAIAARWGASDSCCSSSGLWAGAARSD